ncbi:MAG TPA: hypothetical protein VNA69_06140 [Thermoanaerobaculia bacterium]|nr:hypothetical protein [Thermoanaerobaculia bacterium]
MLQVTSEASEAPVARTLHLWPHALIVLVLLLTQVFVRDVWATIYKHVVRPDLLQQGARVCDSVVHNEGRLHECDLLMEHRSGNTIERTFYAKRGVSKTRVRTTVDGEFLSSKSVHWASIASMVLPFLAFMIFAIAVVHKMVRTHSLFTWQMAPHRWDATERLMLLYSIPLIVAGIVGPWLEK